MSTHYKREPDFIFTRTELVNYLNTICPEGKKCVRHIRDNKKNIISTTVTNKKFTNMDIAEYCRKGWTPKKYLNATLDPHLLSANDPEVIKKFEQFRVYLLKD